jgi:hypothetical protein
MGVKEFSSWNIRQEGSSVQIEPYRKYFFICEGANTETWYFKKLIERRKALNIHPLIDIRFLEKTDDTRDISYPKNLIDFAEKQKGSAEISFDKERDRMVVVFDADVFESKVSDYNKLVCDAEKLGNILGVTNPSFELFLLLHYEGSLEDKITPNELRIIRNEKEGNQTPVYWLLHELAEINCKKNPEIGELATRVEIAIEQEKYINHDIHSCRGKLTSNIGHIIDTIRQDNPAIP